MVSAFLFLVNCVIGLIIAILVLMSPLVQDKHLFLQSMILLMVMIYGNAIIMMHLEKKK